MKIFIVIIVTAVVVGIAAAAVGFKMGHPTDDAATAVRIEEVSRGELVERVSAPGVIEPKTMVSISAKIAARIDELPFEEGDIVTAGDPNADPPVPASVLVKLDARDMEAQLQGVEARHAAQKAQIDVAQARILAQEAQLEAQKAILHEAELDLKRQVDLLATKDVSQSIVDQAQAKMDQLTAQYVSQEKSLEADRANLIVMQHELDAAAAEIARARDALSYTTITSPIDGIITRINAKEGELVVTGTMNNAGTVIMEVADLNKMIVEAKVDESDIASLSVGQPALVRAQAYGEETFDGAVSTIALAETEDRDGTKYYETEIALETNGRRIYSGLTADVDIETQRHQDVLRIPSQAVVGRAVDELPQEIREKPEVDSRKAFTSVVYRIVDGKAVATPVRVGPSDVTHTIVTAGLSEGDKIVVGPYKVLEALKHDEAIKDDKDVATTQPSEKK